MSIFSIHITLNIMKRINYLFKVLFVFLFKKKKNAVFVCGKILTKI